MIFKPSPANPQATLRLFCFPYAGGNAQTFKNWSNYLPDSIEVCAAELPGHGQRMKETPHTDLKELVREMATILPHYFDKPFAFFGHSMGALIAFELTRLLRTRNQPLPDHLFVSGRRAPQIPEDDPPTYNLPDAELIKKLRWLKGTSAKILDDPEMMQLMLPILRADFAVCETYEYQPAEPLSCPLTAFGGWRDPAIRNGGLKGWKEQTNNEFTKKTFPGNHFFLHSAQVSLLKFLQKQLNE